ncbi:MAG TPA: hypothetical protein VJ783_12140 [Pirellulales bacterium]|nr:hypothetical protein [Pirellulales bacterium]
MRALLFPRLVWKEYRVLRGYWLSLLVVGLLIEFFMAQFARDPQLALFSLPWVVAAFFALGAGATLFAIEREEQTIEFLRGLPASPSRLFVGKLTLALGGTLLLGVALSAAALPVVGPEQLRNLAANNTGWILGAPLLLQVVAWGMFFSLLLARPLVAALLATLATFVSCSVVAYVATASDTMPGWRTGWEGVPHALMTVAVFLLDFVLSRRWLFGSARRFRAIRIARATDMRCLWWQESRQSGVVVGAVLALGLLLMVSNWASAGPHSAGTVPIATLIFALFGSCVFLADQGGGQFRYFTERGIDPRRLWLARQLFWAAPAAALMLVYLLAHVALLAMVVRNGGAYDNIESRKLLFFNYEWFGLHLGDPYRHYHQTWHVGWFRQLPGYVLWTALAYGAGQLCSMFFRSGLLAAVFGVIAAALLVAWAALMEFVELSWLFTVAPLAIALFVGTWLRAPDWLIERRDWRARVRGVLVLAVPLATVLIGTLLYRVYEAPAPEIEIAPRAQNASAFAAADARRTADLYARASDLLVKMPSEGPFAELRGETSTTLTESQIAWLDKNEEPLALVLEAAARPDCTFFGTSYRLENGRSARFLELGHLVVLSARQLEDDGQLAAAWTRFQAAFSMARHFHQQPGLFGEIYGNALERMALERLFFWGAHEDQTPDRIRAAIEYIGKLAPLRSMTDEIKEGYGELAVRLFNEGESWSQFDEPPIVSRQLARWMPWELVRSKRTLALLAKLDIDDVQAAESALVGEGKPAEAWYYEDPYARLKVEHLTRTSLFFGVERTNESFQGFSRSVIDSRRSAVAYRRAVRLALAAEAWRLEHDELPDSLARLEGNGLGPLPVDPFTNQAFSYFPFGFRKPISSNELKRLPLRMPLLYSPAMPRGDYLMERIGSLRRESDDAPPASDVSNHELERVQGLVFPIPERF